MIDYAFKFINLWTDAQVKRFYEISSISLCLVFFKKFARFALVIEGHLSAPHSIYQSPLI